MKIIYFFLLLSIPVLCSGQYNKEKLSDILTGGAEKAWNVSSISTAPKEKMIMFKKDNAVIVQTVSGQKLNDKWQLSSNDNIRWFILIGKEKFELIVSYDKKGDEYIKLNHHVASAKSSDYELKLTTVK